MQIIEYNREARVLTCDSRQRNEAPLGYQTWLAQSSVVEISVIREYSSQPHIGSVTEGIDNLETFTTPIRVPISLHG